MHERVVNDAVKILVMAFREDFELLMRWQDTLSGTMLNAIEFRQKIEGTNALSQADLESAVNSGANKFLLGLKDYPIDVGTEIAIPDSKDVLKEGE